MKTVSLSGSKRTNVGKSDAGALRAKGQVPCVIYGTGEQIHFYADEREFKKLIYTPDVFIVDVQVDGNSYKTILQETQYHKVNDKLIHADFLQLVDGKPVTLNIPVKTTGQSEGVKAGGKLMVKYRKLKVRGDISKMPDFIEIDITPLEIGKSISVGDIKLDGLEILHPSNISVVSVKTTRGAQTGDVETETKPAAEAKTAEA